MPALVPAASAMLEGTCTKVCTVVSFPLGYALSASKADEARRLVEAGADEVDMVVNIGAVMQGDFAAVEEDVAAVAEAVAEASGTALLKVILETGYLTPEMITLAGRAAVKGGAQFVKTSTGFGPRGASVEDVRLMRAAVGPDIGVKAAGGIRDLAAALAMIDAGATRIGTSAGLEIVAALLAKA
jgi:deoxyribose-phosphate aldolase